MLKPCSIHSFGGRYVEFPYVGYNLFSPALMPLRDSVQRFNTALFAAAELPVGKAGRNSEPWSTPELREAIKKRNALRQTITVIRAEYLEACDATCKPSEVAR